LFIIQKGFVSLHYKTNNMNYEDFIYAQYTPEQLTNVIAANKHDGSYLDMHVKRCRLEIIKRHYEQQEALEL